MTHRIVMRIKAFGIAVVLLVATFVAAGRPAAAEAAAVRMLNVTGLTLHNTVRDRTGRIFYRSALVDFTVTCDAGAEVHFSSGGFRTRTGGLTNLFFEQSPFASLLCTGAPQRVTLDAIGYPGLRGAATGLMTVAVATTTNSSTQFSFTGATEVRARVAREPRPPYVHPVRMTLTCETGQTLIVDVRRVPTATSAPRSLVKVLAPRGFVVSRFTYEIQDFGVIFDDFVDYAVSSSNPITPPAGVSEINCSYDGPPLTVGQITGNDIPPFMHTADAAEFFFSVYGFADTDDSVS